MDIPDHPPERTASQSVRARACVRACVRSCVFVCVRARVRVRVRVCGCTREKTRGARESEQRPPTHTLACAHTHTLHTHTASGERAGVGRCRRAWAG